MVLYYCAELMLSCNLVLVM